MRITEQSLPLTPALDFERLDREAESAYWLRFLNGRWLVYRHERLIGDFPSENAALALAFVRQKQSEGPVQVEASTALTAKRRLCEIPSRSRMCR